MEVKRRKPGFNGFYPWHEWTDGNEHVIIDGEDFTCTFTAMRQYLYRKAEDLRMGVTIRKLGEGILRFQFYDRAAVEEAEAKYDDVAP